ncbi:MAG: tetratricopeptide repeat protein, partial [Chitinispirillaceae bacterium]|nr:tetratricopeptide repeat protein [Chitinispirillaceae bacterium]
FNLGFAYLQWGRNSNAITEFKKALRYQPASSDIWSNLAIAYENLGQSDNAIGALLKAVQYNPGNITARINLAAMYHNANQFGKAIAHYKEAISMDGMNEEALTNLAKCLTSTGKFAEAKNYLMRAVAANPNNAEARIELGNIYWKNEKKIDKGIEEYKKAVVAQPSAVAAYDALASAYEAKGDKAQAVETLKNSLVYIDEALQKEKVQERIDRLELGDTQKGTEEGGTKLTTKSQIDDLKKELRTTEKTQTQQIETAPVDIMGDLKDLSAAEDNENPLDLKSEAKKKSAEKKSAEKEK